MARRIFADMTAVRDVSCCGNGLRFVEILIRALERNKSMHLDHPINPNRNRWCHGSILEAWCWLISVLLAGPITVMAEDPAWLEFSGGSGAGQGKRVVLMSGDEEYRSEEALPMLAQVLSRHHGFQCTVLFSIDEKGRVDPENRKNTPGLEALDAADLLVIATRFRELPSEQMAHIEAYLKAGKAVVGLRTATHAFLYPAEHPLARYSYDSEKPDFKGGFGRQILGETWVAHHGEHGSQSTRGRLVDTAHPILRGIQDGAIWGPTDVYAVNLPLSESCHVLVEGEVVQGMAATDPAAEGEKNSPRMPIAWTKTYQFDGGPEGRVFTTTMGASQDFAGADVRRLVVNACFWAIGLEVSITPDMDVDPVGTYSPTAFGFGKYQKGRLPRDFLPR